jgi:8-oxo-dGTP pyrophosphatase MutT (NUDIX family)
MAVVGSGEDGRPRVLLLRRVRRAGFVPGAWVFPGGRVDPDDASPATRRRIRGATPREVARRLELEADSHPPAWAYLVAALRETFEETGILVGTPGGGSPPAGDGATLARLHAALLEGEIGFGRVLEALELRPDVSSLAYVAHWITPEVEPRRYDTRFFVAPVAGRPRVRLHEAELAEWSWLPPEEAVERHRGGELPMVFPTVHTLELLAGHDSVGELVAAARARSVPTLLPRLVGDDEGVRIVLPGDDEDDR